MHMAGRMHRNTDANLTLTRPYTYFSSLLSRLTAGSAFPLSVNLNLQTLDAMCQNTPHRLSQKSKSCQSAQFLSKQEAQLLQRDRAMLRVIEYFA